MVLQQVAMVVPNGDGVYAPTRKPVRFSGRLEDLNRASILVSFEPDGVSSPERVAAYGWGLKCWYIVVDRRGCLGVGLPELFFRRDVVPVVNKF